MTPAEVVARFRDLSVLVVGDICLDRWCTYDPSLSEPSRETGIPRIAVVSTEVTPGAGGTVANNLVALGAKRVAVLGAIGDDGFGYELLRALEKRGISSEYIVSDGTAGTFTYTKLINCRTRIEDLPRVDHVVTSPLLTPVEQRVVERLHNAAPQFDLIIVADQSETDCGMVTAGIRQALSALASTGKLVWVDSRKRCELFRGVIVKPNQDEAEAACMRSFGTVDYARLRETIDAPFMIVTLGPEGALVIVPGTQTHVPAAAIERPVDICGAGDSFSAAAALTLAVTGSPLEAAKAGNAAASVTIMKPGTGTVSAAELIAKYH